MASKSYQKKHAKEIERTKKWASKVLAKLAAKEQAAELDAQKWQALKGQVQEARAYQGRTEGGAYGNENAEMLLQLMEYAETKRNDAANWNLLKKAGVLSNGNIFDKIDEWTWGVYTAKYNPYRGKFVNGQSMGAARWRLFFESIRKALRVGSWKYTLGAGLNVNYSENEEKINESWNLLNVDKEWI